MQRPFNVIKGDGPRHPSALKPSAVIFDLDGVLFNLTVCNGRFDWNKVEECKQIIRSNPPNWPMISLLNMIYNQCRNDQMKVILCTGRPERFQEVTTDCLKLYKCQYHELWMRKDDDARHDSKVKESMYNSLTERYNIWFVVEDRKAVVEMWRSKGVMCLQNVEGEY